MIKILKNLDIINDVELDDVGGAIVPASGQKSIDPLHYQKWARSVDVVNHLIAGTLIMNDGTNDLTSDEGVRYLRRIYDLAVEDSNIPNQRVTTTINFGNNLDVTNDSNGKVTVDAKNEGEGNDERLISVVCIPGTNCIKDVSLLVDDKICFIKEEEC